MKLLGVIFEDFINYKVPCMTLEFPQCSMKCNKECGQPVCQNSALADLSEIDVDPEELIRRYIVNPITHAVIMQGMEPFDSWSDLIEFCVNFRKRSDDDIVIYTGYYDSEIQDKIMVLKSFVYRNLIIKFGRYIPNQQTHYDSVLGVNLASNNQYAERIC